MLRRLRAVEPHEQFAQALAGLARGRGIARDDIELRLIAVRVLARRYGMTSAQRSPRDIGLRDTVEAQSRAQIAVFQGVGFLGGERAVIDTRGVTGALKRPVAMHGISRAPFAQLGLAVPGAGFHRGEASSATPAQCGQHMGVVVVRVLAARGVRAVPGDIGDHALGNALLLHKAAHQGDALSIAQLMGQRQQELPRQLGIAAFLHRLDRVPQLRAVAQTRRHVCRPDDLAGDDPAGLGRVIVVAGAHPIMKPFARTIRRSGNHVALSGAGDDAGLDAKQRHTDGFAVTARSWRGVGGKPLCRGPWPAMYNWTVLSWRYRLSLSS